MKLFLKPLFEFITGDFVFFGNLLYNYIAMGIVGLIAYAVAWNFVGKLYRMDIIDSRATGSIIHWTIRLIVFVAVFCLFSAVLWFAALAMTISWWGWLLIGLTATIVIGAVILFKSKVAEKDDRKN